MFRPRKLHVPRKGNPCPKASLCNCWKTLKGGISCLLALTLWVSARSCVSWNNWVTTCRYSIISLMPINGWNFSNNTLTIWSKIGNRHALPRTPYWLRTHHGPIFAATRSTWHQKHVSVVTKFWHLLGFQNSPSSSRLLELKLADAIKSGKARRKNILHMPCVRCSNSSYIPAPLFTWMPPPLHITCANVFTVSCLNVHFTLMQAILRVWIFQMG